MAVVGILAGLALPNLRTVLMRARATELAGDMDVVRVATLSYNAELLSWPSESAAGNVPAGLAPYLPDGFPFAREGYQLDFENWSIPGGLPGDPGTQRLIGVSVVVPDEALGNALLELLGDAIVVSVGGTHTILIDRS
jgi:type II secretory pathway pseudopilin PulG